MNITEVARTDLRPYEKNPRRIPVAAIEAVEESIRRFGFNQPIVVDGENVVVAGHARLYAAERLGMETVPVVRRDDLSEEDIRAYRLADNKTGELSSWEYSLLMDELEALADMEIPGFDADELQRIADAATLQNMSLGGNGDGDGGDAGEDERAAELVTFRVTVPAPEARRAKSKINTLVKRNAKYGWQLKEGDDGEEGD